MTTKNEKRMNMIEKDVKQLKEALSKPDYKSGTILNDLHTMVDNTGFLLYNVKSLIDNQKRIQEQTQNQLQQLYADLNIQDSFIKSKGLQNEYPIYRKDMIEKQRKAQEEAKAKAEKESDNKPKDSKDTS